MLQAESTWGNIIMLRLTQLFVIVWLTCIFWIGTLLNIRGTRTLVSLCHTYRLHTHSFLTICSTLVSLWLYISIIISYEVCKINVRRCPWFRWSYIYSKPHVVIDCLFFTGSLSSSRTLHEVGAWGKENFIFPFLSWQKLREGKMSLILCPIIVG